jgi:hypothetical protein
VADTVSAVTLEQTAAPVASPLEHRPADDSALYRSFNRSVVISGLRCVLTYLLLPYATPMLGLAGAVGPGLGLALGAVALVANWFTIRRFWRARHRWRWLVTGVSSAVIVLLVVMAVRDVLTLAG